MATAGENAWQDTAGAAAEKLAEAAAAAGEALGEEKLEAEGGAGEGNEWSLLTRALVSVVAIAVCFLLVKVRSVRYASLLCTTRLGARDASDWSGWSAGLEGSQHPGPRSGLLWLVNCFRLTTDPLNLLQFFAHILVSYSSAREKCDLAKQTKMGRNERCCAWEGDSSRPRFFSAFSFSPSSWYL